MKRITMMIALVAVLAASAMAQSKKLSAEDQERVFNGKAQLMQKELNLTDEQMVKFLPIYKAFQEDVMNIKRDKVKCDSLTMDAAYKDAVGRLDFNEKVIKAQKKALSELKSVLTPAQLVFFLDAEKSVQKDIHKFKKVRKGHNEHAKDVRKLAKKELDKYKAVSKCTKEKHRKNKKMHRRLDNINDR